MTTANSRIATRPSAPRAAAPAWRTSYLGRRTAAGPDLPRVAYLTNLYPKISHSFIRTEIEALERAGFVVERFTIRPSTEAPAGSEERAEQERTRVLLDRHWTRLLFAIGQRLVRRPGGTTRALLHSIAASCRQGVRIGALARALAYFAEAASLVVQMERSGARHVHVHFGTNPAAVARLAAQMGAITYSFTAHGPDEFDAPVALDLAGKIAEAAFVAGVSSFGRGQLMRWSDPVHWDRIHVVRCSVAPRFLDTPAPRALPRRLVCVARLNAQKGLPLLIEAAARLSSSPPFLLDIIGDGEERAAIEAQINRWALGQRVRLLGWRSPQEVLHEISQARAFVLPSFAEGLPVVLMEALALGRPVIATAIAGIPELVDAESGWLVTSGCAEALADALQEALEAPAQRLRAMGNVGRARVHRLHHPDENAHLLAELLAPLA